MQIPSVLVFLLILSLGGCTGNPDSSRENSDTDTSSWATEEALSDQPGKGSVPAGYDIVAVENPGTVEGRVVLQGERPSLDQFEITTNQDLCGGASANNRLSLGPNGGIEGAVVRLVDCSEGKPFEKRDRSELTVTQSGCRYRPHVLVAPLGARVSFVNADPTPHNVRVEDSSETVLMNVTQASQGERDDLVVGKVGPLLVSCDYHPWMNAYVFGVDNPYVAVSGADGSFVIDGIPDGEYTLEVWVNGVEIRPLRDDRGTLIRYGYSPALVVRETVRVGEGESASVEVGAAFP